MGTLKKQLKTKDDFPVTYHMTDWEWTFVKDLNIALATSTYRQRLMSGILGYIIKTRLGLEPKGKQVFKYEIDPKGENQELVVNLESTKEP